MQRNQLMISSKLASFVGISNLMCEFESFIFWHVRMDSKIILATFRITNVGGFIVILSAMLRYLLAKKNDLSCFMKYFELPFSLCLLRLPPQYTVNKQNLSHNVFILEYWYLNVNFFILKIRMMEVKECEGLKMLKKQLLLFPGLNGLMPWHSYAKVNPT